MIIGNNGGSSAKIQKYYKKCDNLIQYKAVCLRQEDSMHTQTKAYLNPPNIILGVDNKLQLTKTGSCTFQIVFLTMQEGNYDKGVCETSSLPSSIISHKAITQDDIQL